MSDDKPEPKKKQRLIKEVPVKVVPLRGDAVVVEWQEDDVLKRATVPPGALIADGDQHRVTDDVLFKGIPYGVPWADLITLAATPEAIEAELHRVGIWTVDDLRGNTAVAVSALQRIYKVDLAALLQAATRFDRGDETVGGK